MKTILTFLFLLVGTPAFNQVKLDVNKVDEFTGEVVKRTEALDFVIFREPDNGRAYLNNFFISRNGNMKSFTFAMAHICKCLSEFDGKLLIKLTDGTIIECMQTSKTDCSETPWGTYIPIKREEYKTLDKVQALTIMNSNWGKLATIPVAVIRVHSECFINYLPNDTYYISGNFKAKNLFIEHLKALK